MAVCCIRRFSSAWCALQEPFLNQVWFVHFFNRSRFFSNRYSECIQPYRTALVFLDDGVQDPLVHFVESVFIHFKSTERILRNFARHDSAVLRQFLVGLREIAAALQKPVRDSWGPA